MAKLTKALCWLGYHSGHLGFKRDASGVLWVGLRCDRCGELVGAFVSAYQDNEAGRAALQDGQAER